MKIRSGLSVLAILFVGVLLSGCALRHESIIRITDPGNGNTFPLDQPVTIRVHVNTAALANYNHVSGWGFYEFNIIDGGTIIAHGGRSINFDEFEWTLSAGSAGPHYVVVQGRVGRNVGSNQFEYSDWINSNEVCFYVGPDAPSDFCSVRTIVQPLTVTTLTPTPPPTPTPVTPVIIRPNPHNPGGTNPSGCAAFTDQTSCDLAGCSWNYGTCVVNP